MHPSITHALPDIRQLCVEGDVLRLEVFGSAAGDAKSDPDDVDFLVELDTNGAGTKARRWLTLADSLEALLHRRVDLVNPRTIRNPYFARSVNASRKQLYERAGA